MDLVDVLLTIVVIAGPILVFIVAWQYRLIISFIPLSIFAIIWTLWLIFGSSVPFDFVDPFWFYIIAVSLLGGLGLFGAYIRWEKVLKDCDPSIQDCRL